MKPLKGYVLAKIVDKESKLATLDTDVASKSIVVTAVHPSIKEIKKGDEIILTADVKLMGSKTNKGEEFLIIPESGICAIR